MSGGSWWGGTKPRRRVPLSFARVSRPSPVSSAVYPRVSLTVSPGRARPEVGAKEAPAAGPPSPAAQDGGGCLRAAGERRGAGLGRGAPGCGAGVRALRKPRPAEDFLALSGLEALVASAGSFAKDFFAALRFQKSREQKGCVP